MIDKIKSITDNKTIEIDNKTIPQDEEIIKHEMSNIYKMTDKNVFGNPNSEMLDNRKEKCDGCLQSPAISYCTQCEKIYCKQCDDHIHQLPTNKFHER
jgi:hypothetical protein